VDPLGGAAVTFDLAGPAALVRRFEWACIQPSREDRAQRRSVR
jgi:hypothetical protein